MKTLLAILILGFAFTTFAEEVETPCLAMNESIVKSIAVDGTKQVKTQETIVQ